MKANALRTMVKAAEQLCVIEVVAVIDEEVFIRSQYGCGILKKKIIIGSIF